MLHGGAGRRRAARRDGARGREIAPEGFYLILKNPSQKGDHPPSGGVYPAPDLDVGRKINITGPCAFALWPGQIVKLVQGHHLRSNQYLLVRVYNEDEARKNWGQAVIKPASSDGGDVFALTGAITRAGDSYTVDLAARFVAHFDNMDWELDGAVAITAAGVDGTVRHHGTGKRGPLGEQVSVTGDITVDYEAITLDAGGCPTGGSLHAVTAYEATDASFHVEGSVAFGPGCSAAR